MQAFCFILCPCLWLLSTWWLSPFIMLFLTIFVPSDAHFLPPVQNKPLPAEAAVFILQEEVCREDSRDQTQSRR